MKEKNEIESLISENTKLSEDLARLIKARQEVQAEIDSLESEKIKELDNFEKIIKNYEF